MYTVKIFYPKKPGSSFEFNLRHYLEVHVPLGLRLFRQHMGFSPARVECDVNCSTLDGADGCYHVVASLYFETREEAEGFRRLFRIPEVGEQLSADWANFTEVAPEMIWGELVRFDPGSGSRL
jgi:uncharacterized protein (TIGR02118 family)